MSNFLMVQHKIAKQPLYHFIPLQCSEDLTFPCKIKSFACKQDDFILLGVETKLEIHFFNSRYFFLLDGGTLHQSCFRVLQIISIKDNLSSNVSLCKKTILSQKLNCKKTLWHQNAVMVLMDLRTKAKVEILKYTTSKFHLSYDHNDL